MIRHDYAKPDKPAPRPERRGWLGLYMALITAAVLIVYVYAIFWRAFG